MAWSGYKIELWILEFSCHVVALQSNTIILYDFIQVIWLFCAYYVLVMVMEVVHQQNLKQLVELKSRNVCFLSFIDLRRPKIKFVVSFHSHLNIFQALMIIHFCTIHQVKHIIWEKEWLSTWKFWEMLFFTCFYCISCWY